MNFEGSDMASVPGEYEYLPGQYTYSPKFNVWAMRRNGIYPRLFTIPCEGGIVNGRGNILKEAHDVNLFVA